MLALTTTALDQIGKASSPGIKVVHQATRETGAGRANETESARISTNSQEDEA